MLKDIGVGYRQYVFPIKIIQKAAAAGQEENMAIATARKRDKSGGGGGSSLEWRGPCIILYRKNPCGVTVQPFELD